MADEIGATAVPLDVTDAASVDAFCAGIEQCDVLVNNAGGALGLDPVEQAEVSDWATMYDANVLGTLRMTQALLPSSRPTGRRPSGDDGVVGRRTSGTSAAGATTPRRPPCGP